MILGTIIPINDYYDYNNSSVFVILLDASKAEDWCMLPYDSSL